MLIWDAITGLLSRGGNAPISLACKCLWTNETSPALSLEEFQETIGTSSEYAVFFLRALLGGLAGASLEPVFAENSPLVGNDWSGWFHWTAEGVAIENQEIAELLSATTEDDWIGADLVARIALTMTGLLNREWARGRIFYPVPDKNLRHPYGAAAHTLRFASADFTEGKLRPRSSGLDPQYFHYEPAPDGGFQLHSHGWRMAVENSFTLTPALWENHVAVSPGEVPDAARSGAGATRLPSFLAFPAFFKNERCQVVFACTDSHRQKPDELPRDIPGGENNRFVDMALRPYLLRKRENYLGSKAENPSRCGSIVICLGVAAQQTAFFDARNCRATYGVFVTMDIVSPVEEKAVSPEELEHACAILAAGRHLFRSKILNVLAANLLRESEKQMRELKKYEAMYHQLLAPLHTLTRAAREVQEKTTDIRAVFYDPLRHFLGAQPQIALLFIDGDYVETQSGAKVMVTHQPYEYKTAEDACGVANEFFRCIIPEALNQQGGALSARSAERAGLSVEVFRRVIHWFADQESQQTKPYYVLVNALATLFDMADMGKSIGTGPESLPPWGALSGAFERGAAFGGGANARDAELERTVATKLLSKAKEIFFVLYKPENAAKALELKKIRMLLTAAGVSARVGHGPRHIVPKGGNPLSTHGHLVDFITQIALQHQRYHKEHTSEPDVNFEAVEVFPGLPSLVLQSKKEWIPAEDVPLYEKFITGCMYALENGTFMARETGDRMQPFFDLLNRARKAKPLEMFADGGTLALHIGRLWFKFSGRLFTMSFDSDAAVKEHAAPAVQKAEAVQPVSVVVQVENYANSQNVEDSQNDAEANRDGQGYVRAEREAAWVGKYYWHDWENESFDEDLPQKKEWFDELIRHVAASRVESPEELPDTPFICLVHDGLNPEAWEKKANAAEERLVVFISFGGTPYSLGRKGTVAIKAAMLPGILQGIASEGLAAFERALGEVAPAEPWVWPYPPVGALIGLYVVFKAGDVNMASNGVADLLENAYEEYTQFAALFSLPAVRQEAFAARGSGLAAIKEALSQWSNASKSPWVTQKGPEDPIALYSSLKHSWLENQLLRVNLDSGHSLTDVKEMLEVFETRVDEVFLFAEAMEEGFSPKRLVGEWLDECFEPSVKQALRETLHSQFLAEKGRDLQKTRTSLMQAGQALKEALAAFSRQTARKKNLGNADWQTVKEAASALRNEFERMPIKEVELP